MRRITLWMFSTVAALVLLFSYRTSTSTPAAAPEAISAPGASKGEGQFDGSAVPTNWGPVQVRITVADGKVTAVDAPVSPADDPADAGITKGALPSLHEQALAKQSADIDSVSGATFTSAAYKESLQAALDAAQLG
ncbi:FMN-binding protein [Actinoplanes bogorensis]|uniref:FMN-binding protein n=1 Tax=Paractinoplanes bogorensis TaxID=1610840 RepID=A0ABS5Z2E7_9ACTN|nr:FMN-binding protein [Actinoplanes bogorensis]MBU2669108.1 FMN-binding protein [Actinoplanes bogorensis]